MKFCTVCGLDHFDDQSLCDAEEYRYGKMVTDEDGMLTFEPPGDVSELRSDNGNEAVSRGLLPITRAIPLVAHHAHCTRKVARQILKKIGYEEWHHTGLCREQRANYYSVAKAVASVLYGDPERGQVQ